MSESADRQRAQQHQNRERSNPIHPTDATLPTAGDFEVASAGPGDTLQWREPQVSTPRTSDFGVAASQDAHRTMDHVEGAADGIKRDGDRTSPLFGKLGDYELLSELGRGGMGVVYRARQRSLNRIVALKTVLASSAATDREILRFQNEAEAAANLRHPGIVAVYDVGEAEGRHYYSMEFIEGDDLSRLIREHSLPGEQAARYLIQLAEAVQYAHEHGVLHRDLKPSNVLLDSHGRIKITDFGLAKRVHADSQLTGAFSIMGTPSYMPPEQAMPTRGPVGPYSDIYALGAVLYELLTCRPPFRADNPLETMRQVVNEEPLPPRLVNPKIAPDLETICLKCLEKDPARRYDSARTFGEELQRFLDGRPILARPLGRVERLWRLCKRYPREASLIGLVVTAICLGSLGIAWQWRRAEANLESATRSFNLLDQAADEMLVVVEEWVTRAPPRLGSQQEKLKSSLQLFEAFLREEPANLRAQQRLAETHVRVAEIRRLLRQLDEASHHFRQAIRIYQDLNQRNPAQQPWIAELANAWDSLGNTEREAERFAAANDAFQEAITIQQQFVGSRATPTLYADMAKTLYNRGLLLFEQNDVQSAQRDFETSIDMSMQATEREPENAAFLQGLSRCRINLGVLFRDGGKNREALLQYDLAITILDRLAQDFPEENEYAVELAQSHLNRGNLLLTTRSDPNKLTDDPLQASQQSFSEAVRLLTALTSDYPNVPQYHIQLANALNGLGAVRQESGRSPEAQQAWTRARDQFADVLRLSGDSAEVRSRLGLTLSNLALLVPRDQPQQRIPLLQEACAHQRTALEKTPQAKPIKNYLRSHLLSLSRAHLQTGEHAKAVEAAQELAGLELQADDWRVAADLIVRSLLSCRDDMSIAEPVRQATADDYAGRVIAILRRALMQGATSVERLEADEKLAAIKDRADFQTLTREFKPPATNP